jgi:REP-associated tyrosine transposase
MTRKTIFAPEAYYHVYNRGVDRREIYGGVKEYEHFLKLMYLCNSSEGIRTRDFDSNFGEIFNVQRPKTLVEICAYCLMPNHFHILIREKEEGGISAFMQKLATAYTMYFNKRNERAGALLEGSFKAKHIDTDNYLKYLIAYVHLNPVKLVEPDWKETGIKEKKRAQDYLEKYAHSSYQDFLGYQRPQNAILTKGALPDYFDTPTSFKDHIKGWLEYKED